MTMPVPEPAEVESRPLGRRTVVLLFLCTLAIYLLSPVRQNYDSYLAFPTAYSVVHDRTLALDSLLSVPRVRDHYGLIVQDGDHFNRYPWATSMFLVPSVIATDALHAVGIGADARSLIERNDMDTQQAIAASLIAAAVVALVAVLVYERLDPGFRHRRGLAVGIALVLAFGTSLWSTASRALWQHGPTLLAAAIAVLALQRLARSDDARRRAQLAVVAGAAVAAAATFRPTNAVVFVAVVIYTAVRERSVLPWLVGGSALVLVPWLVVNRFMFGTFAPLFHNDVLAVDDRYAGSLATNLVSPSRGILVYSPVVALAALGPATRMRRFIAAHLRPLDVMLAAVVIAHLLVVSANASNWWAGASYGPRFLTDSLVYLAALATPTASTLTAWLAGRRWETAKIAAVVGLSTLVGWSVLVNSQGALSRSTSCWNGSPDIDQHPERVWSWGEPQFLAGARRLVTTASLRKAVLDDCSP